MQFQFVRRASLESDDRVKIYVMLWKNSFTFLMKQSASVFVFLLLSLWRALWRILRAKIEILAVSPLAPSLDCWDCFVVIFFLSMPSKVTVLGHDSESFKPLPIDSGPKLCPRKYFMLFYYIVCIVNRVLGNIWIPKFWKLVLL